MLEGQGLKVNSLCVRGPRVNFTGDVRKVQRYTNDVNIITSSILDQFLKINETDITSLNGSNCFAKRVVCFLLRPFCF